MVKTYNPKVALRRAIIADGWLPKYRDAVKRILNEQMRQAAGRIEAGEPNWQEELAPRWEAELVAKQLGLCVVMAIDGIHWAEVEFGKRATIAILTAAIDSQRMFEMAFADELLLANRTRPSVEAWLKQTSKLETKTSMKRIDRLMRNGIEEGLTNKQVAKDLLDKGIAWNKPRAELMARTATIWGYNRGALLQYEDEGIPAVEWVAGSGACEFCAAMDRTQIPTGEAFVPGGTHLEGEGEVPNYDGNVAAHLDIPWNIEQPPLHPNCRCALMPVI